jgi:hypothetical protein
MAVEERLKTNENKFSKITNTAKHNGLKYCIIIDKMLRD